MLIVPVMQILDPPTVLLLEDEPMVRDLAARELERAGYRVVAARDGVEALLLAESEPVIDLVVADVMLPRLGGPEFVRVLRSRRPEVPALFISGYAEDPLGEPGAWRSGDAFLPKPFTLRRLADAAAAVLGAPRAV
ncbi:MAG TPA: response regulator [Planctomycetota bacterium]|nr:response regulator [Planctomycetota bacterium]